MLFWMVCVCPMGVLYGHAYNPKLPIWQLIGLPDLAGDQTAKPNMRSFDFKTNTINPAHRPPCAPGFSFCRPLNENCKLKAGSESECESAVALMAIC